MWSVFVIFVLCGATTEIYADSLPMVSFTLSHENAIFRCNEIKVKQYRITAVENQRLLIHIDYDRILNRIICARDGSHENILLQKINIVNLNLVVDSIQQNMTGIWKCQILAHKNTPILQPRFNVGSETYAIAYCYVRVDVRREKAPQTVHVNNMVLNPTTAPYNVTDYDYSVVYSYKNNDEVDIYCFQNDNTDQCSLELNYDHIKDLYNDADATDENFQGHIGINAYMLLRAGHHNRHVDCIRTCNNEKQVLRIIFNSTNFDDVNFIVNGRPARILTVPAAFSVRVTYELFINEQINIHCGTGYICNNMCTYEGSDKINCNFTLSNKNIQNTCSLYCISNSFLFEIQIKRNNYGKGNSKLDLTYSKSNAALDIYAPGGTQLSKRLVYYEYDEDQHDLTINCTTTVKRGALIELSTNDAFNTKQLTDTMTVFVDLPPKKKLVIYLNEIISANNYSKQREIVTIAFSKKIVEITSTEDSHAATEKNITKTDGPEPKSKATYIAIGTSLVLILACLALVFYKLCKRNENTYDYPVFPREPMQRPTATTSVNSLNTDDPNDQVYCYAVPH